MAIETTKLGFGGRFAKPVLTMREKSDRWTKWLACE